MGATVTVETDVHAMMQRMFRDMTEEAIRVTTQEAQEVVQQAVQVWPVGPGIPFHSWNAFTVTADGVEVTVANGADYVLLIPVAGTGRTELAVMRLLISPALGRLAQLRHLLQGLLTLRALNG